MVEAVSHAATYPSQKASYSAGYAEILEVGRATTAVDYAAIAIWRRELRGRLARLFDAVDLLVAPAFPIEPPSVEDLAAMLASPPLSAAPLVTYTIPFNLAGTPTLTLPMGFAESGAPLGFQLIGPHLGEAALLSAGAAYEQASGFAERHPSL